MEKIWLSSYAPGVPAEIDLSEYASIPHIMETAYDRFADKPAFHQMGKTITYRELRQLSRQFGSYLQNELNLQPGARVALMMPNVLQYPVSLFGILSAGMVVVNVNPLYTARELQHQLNDASAETIVIFANSAHVLEEVVARTPVRNIIITGIGDMLGFPKSLLVNTVIKHVKKMVPAYDLPRAVPFMQALSRGNAANFRPADVKQEDIAFLQYTGGTTGVSKGAVLTHRNIVANVLQARAWIRKQITEGSEIMITPLPLYHIFSLTANCLVFSSIGALNVLITNPRDFPHFVKELKKWKFTAMTGVNTLFNALLNTEGFNTVDFSHLKTSLGGGMAVQEPVARRWKEVTGVTLVEAYGLTETSPAACMNPIHIKEYSGYIGLPISSTLVSIRDDEDREVPLNEVGEICIQGPQVTKGYYNRPEETARVFTADGFFKTGDMGYMTEQGYVKLVDRKKDMVNVSGFNVYPNEIEEVVMTHPKVMEAAVIGVPDDKSGEAVKLFVVKKDSSLTVDEIKDFCKKNLTGYKVPKHYEFRDILPKTNVGKILRKDLRG
ncbi:MAG: AMP-binding protein [Thermodesulfobacteriota bacterium]